MTHLYIDKGLFAMLPFGQRIIDKVIKLIEIEFLAIGAQKMEVPILGAKRMWSKSGRWEAMALEMFKLEDRAKNGFCLQPTAEEMFTKLVGEFGTLRATQLPLLLYQVCHQGPLLF